MLFEPTLFRSRRFFGAGDACRGRIARLPLRMCGSPSVVRFGGCGRSARDWEGVARRGMQGSRRMRLRSSVAVCPSTAGAPDGLSSGCTAHTRQRHCRQVAAVWHSTGEPLHELADAGLGLASGSGVQREASGERADRRRIGSGRAARLRRSQRSFGTAHQGHTGCSTLGGPLLRSSRTSSSTTSPIACRMRARCRLRCGGALLSRSRWPESWIPRAAASCLQSSRSPYAIMCYERYRRRSLWQILRPLGVLGSGQIPLKQRAAHVYRAVVASLLWEAELWATGRIVHDVADEAELRWLPRVSF